MMSPQRSLRPALSTIACPDWTLQRVASAAGGAGYLGVELHTLGFGDTDMACDPLLSDAAHVRSTLGHDGVVPMCLATTIGFDDPIFPPVLGLLRDTERSVRQTRRVIEFASAMGCPFVRVFAADPGRTTRKGAGVRWIVERVRLAADRCRNMGVQLLIENCGPFASASNLSALLDRINLPLLVGASYSVAAGQPVGDRISDAVARLGDRLHIVRLADQKNCRPCPLGKGDLSACKVLDELRQTGFDGWVVNEYDRLSQPDLTETDEAIAIGPSMILTGSACLPTPTTPMRQVAAV